MNKENIHTIARNILKSYYPKIKSDTISTSRYPNIININQLGRQYILKIHNPLIAANLKQLDKIYSICSEKKLIPRIIQSTTGNYIQKHGTIIVSLQYKIPHDDSKIDPTVLGQRVATLHSVLDSLQIRDMKNHFERVVYDMLNLSIQYGCGKLIPIIEKVIELTKKNPRQVIHGDLHKNNIINHRQCIYFIDLDSANSFLPVSEIAFSAFKIYGVKDGKIWKYINSYNKLSESIKIEYEYVWHFVVYNVLQRILYIRIENDKGNEKCMWDLPNQEIFLQEVLEHCKIV